MSNKPIGTEGEPFPRLSIPGFLSETHFLSLLTNQHLFPNGLMKSLPQTSAQSLHLGKLWTSSDNARGTVLPGGGGGGGLGGGGRGGSPEMSKATARSDLREALRFAQGCANRKGPMTGTGLAPWASDSSFGLVFPPLTRLVPDLSTAYSRVPRPKWTHLSLRSSLSHSNHRNPFACVNQA